MQILQIHHCDWAFRKGASARRNCVFEGPGGQIPMWLSLCKPTHGGATLQLSERRQPTVVVVVAAEVCAVQCEFLVSWTGTHPLPLVGYLRSLLVGPFGAFRPPLSVPGPPIGVYIRGSGKRVLIYTPPGPRAGSPVTRNCYSIAPCGPNRRAKGRQKGY